MNESRLEVFLARIYVDQRARERFLADPRGEATRAGLAAHEIDDVVNIDRDGLELLAHSLEHKRAHKHGHKKNQNR
ncbi:MAG TPA: hypothetical protein VJS13_04475 [Pyrinomonadaceae bacterium]|nr:hypothetical protein [Pyrinomonadaceae bacterium]